MRTRDAPRCRKARCCCCTEQQWRQRPLLCAAAPCFAAFRSVFREHDASPPEGARHPLPASPIATASGRIASLLCIVQARDRYGRTQLRVVSPQPAFDHCQVLQHGAAECGPAHSSVGGAAHRGATLVLLRLVLLRLVPSAIACVSLADSPVPARSPQPLRSRSRRTS